MSELARPGFFDRVRISDALSFWELGRLPFNLVLVAVTLAWLQFGGPAGWGGVVAVPFQGWLALFVLGVLTNMAYSAAYPVDLFVQGSDWRDKRLAWRTALWAVGTALAAALASLLLWGVLAGVAAQA
jgi:hypothetical protein